MLTKIATEQLRPENSVFLAIFCRTMRPYLHYEKATPEQRITPVPRLLMQVRADGRMGFPGGGVDEGETLRQGLKREVKQEIDFDIDESAPVAISSHGNDERAAHLYALEVDEATFRKAVSGAFNAEHADSELCGVVTPNIEFTGPDKGIAAILKWPMPFSGRSDLILLIEKLALLSGENLAQFRKLAEAVA